MKVRYFEDTDTLYIELRDAEPTQTEELNDNVMLAVIANQLVVLGLLRYYVPVFFWVSVSRYLPQNIG